MPVNAKFTADFSSFESAVRSAEVKLKTFADGASSAEKSLSRVGNSFSGVKIVQEATLMAKALQNAGGISALTDKEILRMGNTMGEAAQKMERMGAKVPPVFRDVAAAADAIKSPVDGAAVSFTKFVAGFFTAQVVFEAFKKAAHAVIDELKALTIHGAEVGDVTENFGHLTEQAGLLGTELLGTLRAGTHRTITDFELMKTVNQDLAAGMALTTGQFDTLSKGAFALAQATGGDVKTALDTMNDAMLTGRTRSLALLTGKIDLQAAEEKFAASIGTTAKQLSDEGKLEAARLGILDAVTKATERLGDQTDGLDEKLAQARTQWANFEEDLGRTVANSPVILGAMDAIGKAITDAFGTNQDDRVRALADSIDAAAVTMLGFGQIVISSTGFAIKAVLATKIVFGNLAQVIDMTLASVQTLYAGINRIDAMTSFGKASRDATARADELSAAVIKTLDRMTARKASMDADSRAQDAVDATTKRLNDSLAASVRQINNTRLALLNHRDATVGFIGPQEVVTQGAQRGTAAFIDQGKAANKAAEDFAKMSKAAAGAEFSWQRSLDLTRFKAEQLAVVESRLFANRAAQPFTSPNLTNVSGAHRFEANPTSGDFSGVTSGPVALPTAQIEEAATKVDKLHKSLSGIEQVLGGVQTAWAQTMTIAVRAIEAVTTKLAEGDWVGALVAAGAALGQFVVRLFRSEESAKVSPLRDVFFKAAGGLEVLNAKALQATGSLAVVQAVFDAKTVDQYNKAIQGVNDALAEYEKKVASAKGLTDGLRTKLDGIVAITPDMEAAFDAAFEATTLDGFNAALGTLTTLIDDQAANTRALDDTMKKYGLSWTKAGDQAKAAKLGEIAQGLSGDFDRLMRAGFDVNEVMRHMGGSVNEFVKQAKASGGEVPESFRRIIQTAIDAGEIFDANGVKITDMKDLGLTFGTTMETTMKNVGLAIERLVKLLEDRLAPAIQNLPDKTVTIHGKFDFPEGGFPQEFPQGFGGDNNVPGFAGGTQGRLLDFGSGRLVRLHGREGVFTESDAARGNASVESIEDVKDEIAALRRDFLFNIPNQMAKATAVAFVKAGRR